MLSKYFLLTILLVISTILLYSQWDPISTSPTGTVYDIVESNGVLFLAHMGDGVYKSTDSTNTWLLISNGLVTIQAKRVYQLLVEETTLYAATTDGIYKSTNGGENWVKKSNGITIGPGAIYEFTYSIFRHSSILLTGAHNGIYYSTDEGENWIVTNMAGSHVNAQFFVNHNGILFAARESNNQPFGYKSTDDGLTWDFLSSISLPTITFLSEPGKLWAGTDAGVWLSTDNGLSWIDRSNGLALDPYNSSIIRVNGKLISSVKFGGSGIFVSTNDGINWEDFGEGLPFLASIDKLILFGDKIIAATSNGLFQRDTSQVITGFKVESNNLPQAYKLYQNYPNPFNPTTTIEYSIPADRYVSLKIFNAMGEEVESLINEFKSAGEYEIDFNAGNLTTGIYFYKIQVGDFEQTKKMILLK